MPKIAFSLKTQLFSYTYIRHNCLEQDSSALFLDHFFPLLTFIQVPWALIWSELSSVWPVLLVVSWLPAGGSERGADWLPSNQSWYLNRDGAKVWKSPNLCVELKLIKWMSKGQLVTRKAEGFHERMVASGGVPWEHRHQPCTSSPLMPPSIWVLMSSCDSMSHGRHSPLPHFFLKDESGGSQASRISSDNKMDGFWAETSSGLPDIWIFPFVKN